MNYREKLGKENDFLRKKMERELQKRDPVRELMAPRLEDLYDSLSKKHGELINQYADLAEENARLREIAGRLPNTADGVGKVHHRRGY